VYEEGRKGDKNLFHLLKGGARVGGKETDWEGGGSGFCNAKVLMKKKGKGGLTTRLGVRGTTVRLPKPHYLAVQRAGRGKVGSLRKNPPFANSILHLLVDRSQGQGKLLAGEYVRRAFSKREK